MQRSLCVVGRGTLAELRARPRRLHYAASITYRSYDSLAPPPPRDLLAALLAAQLAAQLAALLAAYQPDAAVLRHACASLLSQGVPAERPGAAHSFKLAGARRTTIKIVLMPWLERNY